MYLIGYEALDVMPRLHNISNKIPCVEFKSHLSSLHWVIHVLMVE